MKLHLAGAQHGTGDVISVDARAVRSGTIVVLAVCRNLADEILAHHGVGNGERLFVADVLSVIGDVVAVPNRAGKPGIGPGASARIGDGLSQSAVPVVLDLIVHVCPERIARVERARLRGIRVVLILGVLDEDLSVVGQRRGGSGDSLRFALLRGDRCYRDRRFGVRFFSIRRIARRHLIDKGARNGRSVARIARSTGITRSIGALLIGRVVRSNLGIACVRIARNSIRGSSKRRLISSGTLGIFVRESRARSKRRGHRHRDKHGNHALPKSLCILMGVIFGNAARGRAICRIATDCERFSARKEWTESHRYLTSRAQCDG